jgi:hypothetical protein
MTLAQASGHTPDILRGVKGIPLKTLSSGFAADEDPEHLGEQLRVLRIHAHLRARLEQTLTPIVNPRTRERAEA